MKGTKKIIVLVAMILLLSTSVFALSSFRQYKRIVSSSVSDIWVDESGDTMTGNLNMGYNNLQDVNNLEISDGLGSNYYSITYDIPVNFYLPIFQPTVNNLQVVHSYYDLTDHRTYTYPDTSGTFVLYDIDGNINISGNINVAGCIIYNGGTLGTCI